MGHGYYFNGINSKISIPYSPAFNLPSRYSICAVVNVQSYYSGLCQYNVIFIRGNTAVDNASYNLAFSDKPTSGLDCYSYDSTMEVFWTGASGSGVHYSPASLSEFAYTPYITSNTWYRVIATFNDTVYKVFVNGILKATATITNPGVPFGLSTDSACIGFAPYDAASGYPYPFKGIIDDVMLYDRVLSDSEITHYGTPDTCGTITVNPIAVTGSVGGNVTYYVSSTIASPVYQWQIFTSGSFANLTDIPPYSGTNTDTLKITGVSGSISGSQFRCIVSGSFGCTDTSNSALLTTSIDDLTSNDIVTVYSNPATNTVVIQAPENLSSVSLINNIGQIVEMKIIANSSLTWDMSNLPSGIYFFKIQKNNSVLLRKVLKL